MQEPLYSLRSAVDAAKVIEEAEKGIPASSRHTGLRSLVPEKQQWSKSLGAILWISFGVQWLAILYSLICIGKLDDWTLRALALQPTVMFVAALRFLFK